MRKIISIKDEGKKKRRNQFLVGGILILVMVMSTIGYSFTRDQQNNNGNTKIIFNGYEFTQVSGFWNLNIGNAQFSFKYNPNETQKINSKINPISNYSNKPLYIYSQNPEAEIEIYRNLFYQNKIVQRVQDACPQGETCDSSLPVKTCDDNFVIIKESNITQITQDKNCVFIEGKNNLTMLSDSFLYKIIGVQ